MSDTRCNECTFYSESPYDFIPICELNKYELYKQKGVKMEEHTLCGRVLKDFTCPFNRGSSWQQSDEYDSIEDQIITENGFPYSVFIYEDDIDIEQAVAEILALDHAPQYLHITFRYMHQDQPLLERLIEMIESHKDTIKYKLNIGMDEPTDNFYSAYLAFRLEVKTPFIAIYFDNWPLNANLTTETMYKVQRDLVSFPFMSTPYKEFMLFPTSILEEYISFEGPRFINKILETYPLCQDYLF